MFRSALLVSVTALSAAVNALNYSTSGPLSVDVSQISSATLQSWCRAQTNSCPEICGGQASPNTCDQTTLAWNCTCTNGNKPNISSYDQTVPSFICQEWKANCVANFPNDLEGQTGCLSVTCGNKNASGAASTTSSSASTATATATGSATSAASASGASASATTSSAAMALNIAQQYGTGIMGAGLLAVFGLAL